MDTKLMIFDLDGTLLDTIGDLAACCDHVLAARGLPLHTYEEYCGFVGNGVCGWSNGRCPRSCARRKRWRRCVRIRGLLYRTYRPFYTSLRGYSGLLRELVQRGVRLDCSLPTNFKSVPRSWCGSYFPSIPFRCGFRSAPRSPAQTRSAGGAGDSRRYGCGIRSGAVRRGFGRRYGYGPGSRCPVGRCDLGLPRPGGVV